MGALKKHHFGPSRSDSDWRAAKALKNFAGFIFVCSKSTIPDPDRGIFGLRGYYEECVRNIRKGMPLFLFNYSSRRLYGVFEAASDGGYNLDPHVWENNDHSKWRHPIPVSKYPAQVKVTTWAKRPALEEDSFRSILDYVEGPRFRLELTALQVQQLLCLFDAAQAAKKQCIAVRQRGKRNSRPVKYHEPMSTCSTSKSDSDSYSDCSSRGLNSCEDEWTDEAGCENLHHEDHEGVPSQRLSQVNLDGLQRNAKCLFGMHGAPEDQGGVGYYSNDEGNAQKRLDSCSGSDSENTMFLRLQETDPAVNSNSNHCIQMGVDQSAALIRQDAVVTMPLVSPSQMQFPFACGDNVFLIPLQTMPPQKRDVVPYQSQSHRLKWSEQKRYSRGSSNSRKQGFNQERSHKYKDSRHQTQQQMLADNVAARQQKLQLLVPLCSQRPGQIQQDPAQLANLSPLVMSQNPEALTFPEPQTGVMVEQSGQGFGIANDGQVLPEELRDLQNGHFPIFYMHSAIPRLPAAAPQPSTAGFVKPLHYEILHFARWTRPSSNIQLHVEAGIDCVRKGVKSVWPEADVEVFGSFATGLCLQHSDVDIAVIDAPRVPSVEGLPIAQASASLIRELAAALRTYEWCESIKPLDTASMPVLKCLCRPFGSSANASATTSTIAVDITIGGMRNSYFNWNPAAQVLDAADLAPVHGKFLTRHTGGAAREYVLHKIQELPALAPLVLLLKSYLHHKNLSNVYSGGLGSFSLTLLVAFYLERVSATRDFFSDRDVNESSMPDTSSPVSCSSDLSEDSRAPSSSYSLGTANYDAGFDYSSHTLGERYVRRAADVIERIVSYWDQDGSPYLGILLLGFLRTFGFELDLSREKIILKGIDGSPGGCFKREDRHVALWIDDPLRPGVNIGAGSFGMVHVQTAFKELWQSLTKCPVFIPPLQCDDKDCQDLAVFSQLAHIGCIVVAADDF